jgi:hypothetical protein
MFSLRFLVGVVLPLSVREKGSGFVEGLVF